MSDVTQILSQIESGDPAAAEQLLPLVYEELRKLAAAKLAHEKPWLFIRPRRSPAVSVGRNTPLARQSGVFIAKLSSPDCLQKGRFVSRTWSSPFSLRALVASGFARNQNRMQRLADAVRNAALRDMIAPF